jgi:hypothetical protein
MRNCNQHQDESYVIGQELFYHKDAPIRNYKFSRVNFKKKKISVEKVTQNNHETVGFSWLYLYQ